MYTRNNPSTKYLKQLNYYQEMHRQGYNRVINGKPVYTSANEAYPGNELVKYAQPIAELIKLTGAKSILDYGAGKGFGYEKSIEIDGIKYPNIQTYWNIDDITRYEPALENHNQLPEKKFDGVVCTDVLEHIPIEDVIWVIEELFFYAKKFIFVNIACYPALAQLPNGENAHCTIKHPQWWAGIFHSFSHKHPQLKYLLGLVGPAMSAKGDISNQLVWIGNLQIRSVP